MSRHSTRLRTLGLDPRFRGGVRGHGRARLRSPRRSRFSLGADWLAAHVFDEAGLAPVLALMAWAIPGLTIAGVLSFAFQGLRRIALHLLYFSVLTPLLTLTLYFGRGSRDSMSRSRGHRRRGDA